MRGEERQRAILETLDRDGRVLVVDLAKHFQTSTVTIRAPSLLALLVRCGTFET